MNPGLPPHPPNPVIPPNPTQVAPRPPLHPPVIPVVPLAPVALMIPANPTAPGNQWNPPMYLTIPSIHFDLSFLNKKDYEFSVRSAWIAILGNYFPRNHGYSLDIEARNNEGWSDILVRALPAGPHLFDMRPPPFLIIQCKKVKYEARDSEWLGAKHQLQRYFRGIYVGYDPNSPASGGPEPNNVYGAIAIGRFVRFYWYNRGTRRIKVYTPRPDSKRWHVVDESHFVHHVLNIIRGNH